MDKVINTKEVIERLKAHYEIPSDAELATFLGVSRPTVSAWKARNSLDWNLVFEKCYGIDLSYLIYGEELNNTHLIQNVNLQNVKSHKEPIDNNTTVGSLETENMILKAKLEVYEQMLDKMIGSKANSLAEVGAVGNNPNYLDFNIGSHLRAIAAEPKVSYSADNGTKNK